MHLPYSHGTRAVSDQVRELAELHDTDDSAVIQQAVETGVETLYRDMIITRYGRRNFRPSLRDRALPESEVFERALERGLEDRWDDLVLAQYLDGDLEREKVIELVGRTNVERVEREHEVIMEDVSWSLNA